MPDLPIYVTLDSRPENIMISHHFPDCFFFKTIDDFWKFQNMCEIKILYLYLQWNLGIRDTQGTVNNCPEFWGGLISHSMYWIGLGTEEAVLNSQVVLISQVVLKAGFTVYAYLLK